MRRARGNKKAGDFVSSEILDHYDYQESSSHNKPGDPNIPPNPLLKPAENNDGKDENESRTSDSKKNQEAIFEINNSARAHNINDARAVSKAKRKESNDLDPNNQHEDEYPHIEMKIQLNEVDKSDSKQRRGKASSQQDSLNEPQKQESEAKIIDPAPAKPKSPAKENLSPVEPQNLTLKLDAEPEHFSEGEEIDSLNHKLLGCQKKSEYILSMLFESLQTVSHSDKINVIRNLYSRMSQPDRRVFDELVKREYNLSLNLFDIDLNSSTSPDVYKRKMSLKLLRPSIIEYMFAEIDTLSF